MKLFLLAASALGFLGVALGAFGAHGLATVLEANQRADTFNTANRYHLYHAIALFAVAWLATQTQSNLIPIGGGLLIAGTIVFSGSLYLLAIFNIRWMGAIAPIGGALLLAGWACLGWSAWRDF
jgi:uncharacterized membrane protein YgdD (TMEM256/DUF423 family)